MAVQSEDLAVVDEAVQSEDLAVVEAEVQSEDVAVVQAAVQSEDVAVVEAAVQVELGDSVVADEKTAAVDVDDFLAAVDDSATAKAAKETKVHDSAKQTKVEDSSKETKVGAKVDDSARETKVDDSAKETKVDAQPAEGRKKETTIDDEPAKVTPSQNPGEWWHTSSWSSGSWEPLSLSQAGPVGGVYCHCYLIPIPLGRRKPICGSSIRHCTRCWRAWKWTGTPGKCLDSFSLLLILSLNCNLPESVSLPGLAGHGEPSPARRQSCG